MTNDMWNISTNNNGDDKLKKMPTADGNNSVNRVDVLNNQIYFYSGVTDDKILDLNKALSDMQTKMKTQAMISETSTGRIRLFINSGGGSVFAGTAGMDTILSSEVPVDTVVEGCAASAATFLSVVGSERMMRKHSYMLIHQLSSAFWGKYFEFKDNMDNLDRLMEMIRGVYREHSKVPPAKLDAILKKDIWWDADTCKRYGLIDKII